MHNLRNVGTTITELRTERGIKQKKLSAILSMSPSNLSNYENGVYGPDINTLCKIADLFQVTTDYLLGRTDYRYPPGDLYKIVTSEYNICSIVNILLSLDSGSLEAIVHYARYLKDTQGSEKAFISHFDRCPG